MSVILQLRNLIKIYDLKLIFKNSKLKQKRNKVEVSKVWGGNRARAKFAEISHIK